MFLTPPPIFSGLLPSIVTCIEMEASKLQQALDEILKKCKDAGHRLHVFKKEDIELETVVGE